MLPQRLTPNGLLVHHAGVPFGTLLGLVCAFVACSREPPSMLERGQRSFVRACSGCHGLDGRGIGRGAIQLDPPPRDLTDPTFHAERSDEQLLFVLRNGKGTMPPFGMLLDDRELDALLLYVRSLPKSRK